MGNQRTLTYDANSNLASETDENSNLTQYDYDVLDRLSQVTTPVSTYGYDYDQAGNLTRVLDGNGHPPIYAYNDQNLPISMKDGKGFETKYVYDDLGNLTERRDAKGNVTTYSYDALNRLTQKTYDGNTDIYTYDANSNLTSCSNNNVTIEFTYDALDRLIQKKYVQWNTTINYTYDANGNRLTMTDSSSGTTTYTYDAMNRLTEILNPSDLLTTFQYDNAGRLTQQTNGNGTKTIYTYDSADRVLSIVHQTSADAVLRSFAYTYDNKGNRLTMTDENGGVNTYAYDGADRLTSVTYADGQTETFIYDLAGNRTQLLRNGIATTYTYDEADRLLAAGDVTYAFDANGNMTEKTDSNGITTYIYDGENRLSSVTLPDGALVNFQYDPFGNRLVKSAPGDLTRFVIDGVNILMEMDGSNGLKARYTMGFGYDSWIGMKRNGSDYFFHSDALGSVYGLSNASEALDKTYDYFVFGAIKEQVGSLENSITYTGRELDEQIGLYYYRTRYYSASEGRLQNKDSFAGWIDDPQSINKFSYAGNNPVNLIDPNGQLAIVPIIVGAVAVYAAWELYNKIKDAKNAYKCAVKAAERWNNASSDDIDEQIDAYQNRNRHFDITAKRLLRVGLSIPGTSISGPVPASLNDVAIDVAKDKLIGSPADAFQPEKGCDDEEDGSLYRI